MGLPVRRYTAATWNELERASQAARKSSEEGRKSRKTRRKIRKDIQDLRQEEEGLMYGAGAFKVE